MAEDPFVTSSTSQPTIYRPIPRRNFSTNVDSSDSPTHAFAPSTPPSLRDSQNRGSEFLAQLNARLLQYNARNGNTLETGAADGGSGPPPRNKSFLNMTKSTLSGIYDEEGSTAGERSVAETPWGTGAETPARKSMDAGRWENPLRGSESGLTMTSRLRNGTANGYGPRAPQGRHASGPQRKGIWKCAVVAGKLAALFLFGVVYGVTVSHLHDSRELAAVRVEGVDRGSWTYLASWGIAGIALGCSLPFVELAWERQTGNTRHGVRETEKEHESSLTEQWNDIVRSVGAFVGIAFAIVSSLTDMF